MDYDLTNIPETYDAGRGYDSATLAQWLTHICSHVPIQDVSDILDLGCGTGRFSKALADQFKASVTGIDPSEKMLDQAKLKHADSEITFLQSSAEDIPLEDSSVDLVFMSMVYHHLIDPGTTASECRRVLKPSGYVVLRNSTSEQEKSFPYIDYFPGVGAIIREFQPSAEEVIALFLNLGFEKITHDVLTHNMAPNWNLFTEKMKLRADSITARLPEAEFKEGIRALEAHAAIANQDEPVTVNVDLFVFQA
jgi:2-polyprenyl-3-methyl-5-hydroxy-6-metoxy-1,4-benzoquinol methylase